MGRLCERPGCSEHAALAYGMRPEDLVFWIDVLRDGAPRDTGVLCQRHGDSMTVPRGWTLDDLRDPDLHLFRPPPRPDVPATPRNRPRRRAGSGDGTGQLALDGVLDDLDAGEDVRDEDVRDEDVRGEDVRDDGDTADERVDTEHVALDWKPAFDDGDDLDGLLAARSPLLARAFRGERS